MNAAVSMPMADAGDTLAAFLAKCAALFRPPLAGEGIGSSVRIEMPAPPARASRPAPDDGGGEPRREWPLWTYFLPRERPAQRTSSDSTVTIPKLH